MHSPHIHHTEPPAVSPSNRLAFRWVSRERFAWLCSGAVSYGTACLFGFDGGFALMLMAIVAFGLLSLWSCLRLFECWERAFVRLLLLAAVPGLSWAGFETGRILDRTVVAFQVSKYDAIAERLLRDLDDARLHSATLGRDDGDSGVSLKDPPECIASGWAGTDSATGVRVVALKRSGCLLDQASMFRRSLERYPEGVTPKARKGSCYRHITGSWYEWSECAGE